MIGRNTTICIVGKRMSEEITLAACTITLAAGICYYIVCTHAVLRVVVALHECCTLLVASAVLTDVHLSETIATTASQAVDGALFQTASCSCEGDTACTTAAAWAHPRMDFGSVQQRTLPRR